MYIYHICSATGIWPQDQGWLQDECYHYQGKHCLHMHLLKPVRVWADIATVEAPYNTGIRIWYMNVPKYISLLRESESGPTSRPRRPLTTLASSRWWVPTAQPRGCQVSGSTTERHSQFCAGCPQNRPNGLAIITEPPIRGPMPATAAASSSSTCGCGATAWGRSARSRYRRP